MTVEVKTKLTLDDNASASLDHLKQGFQETSEHAEKAKEGFSAVNLVLTEMAAHVLERGIEKVKEFGGELIEAASHGQQVEQRLAGMTAAVQGVDWKTAREGAVDYFQDVQNIAVRTMQPIDDVEAGFNRLVEIQGATPQGLTKARKEIEEMAQVARVLGTSVETIGGQFAFMEEGTLKVKSQMFQLLQPTGIFQHGTMKATEYWQKLNNEQRADLLSVGLEKLAGSMQKATPTFKDSVNQLKNVWDEVEENFGGEVIKAVEPQIERLSKYINSSNVDLKHWAETIGDTVGPMVVDAGNAVKDGFEWLKDHQLEIADDIRQAWAFAREVMGFIIDHKEVLAAVAIGRSELGRGVASAAVGSFGTLSKAGAGMAAGIGVEAEAGLAGAAVSATLALGVLAAAVGSVALAIDQWDQLMAVTGGGKSEDQMDFAAVQKRFQEMIKAPDMSQWGAGELEKFDHMRANLISLADKVGESGRAANDLAEAAYEAHHSSEELIRPFKQAAEQFDALAISTGQLDSGGAVEKISEGFSAAGAAHNQAAQQYIANILSGDAALQAAFLNSSDLTAEGYASLASMVSDSAAEFKDKLLGLAGAAGKATKEVKPVVNFSGGQSFRIEQSFRDQDPDRIAIVFRNDILKAATNRIQAVTSTPFGA